MWKNTKNNVLGAASPWIGEAAPCFVVRPPNEAGIIRFVILPQAFPSVTSQCAHWRRNFPASEIRDAGHVGRLALKPPFAGSTNSPPILHRCAGVLPGGLRAARPAKHYSCTENGASRSRPLRAVEDECSYCCYSHHTARQGDFIRRKPDFTLPQAEFHLTEGQISLGLWQQPPMGAISPGVSRISLCRRQNFT